jgi:hypothetical protein
VDDILRLLRLGSDSGGRDGDSWTGQGGSAAAERLMRHASADGAGSGTGASSWLHGLGDDDDFLISREAHEPDVATYTAAAAAAVRTESAPARDQSRPRISFANALPPRLPAGEPVRRSTAQLRR